MLELACHPDTPCGDVTAIRVETGWEDGLLSLRYVWTGNVGALSVPAPLARPASAPRDGLWRHMCAELFVMDGAGGYREYNYAPSGEWAAYGFTGYREGMRRLDAPPPERVEARLSADRLALDISHRIELPMGAAFGLSAVVEHGDGGKSYWALRHPAGKPDFHHPDCFAASLAAGRLP